MGRGSMTSKEYTKLVADVRRSVGRKYGFRQRSYVNFRVEEGYFFCLCVLYTQATLTAKPMYSDDLWWDIWKSPENKKEPLSLRGIGVFSLTGQVLLEFNDITQSEDVQELQDAFEAIFQDSSVAISQFLEENPDPDKFIPDITKIESFDRDKLLYLVTLIHNGREVEVLKYIKDARRRKHHCMFNSFLMGDDYTFIRNWCRKLLFFKRVKRHPFWSRLLKYSLGRRFLDDIGSLLW